MITKYKVNEVSKDFGLQNKEIIELLGKYFEEPKKSQTALDSKELDVLFDVLTQEHSVESFDAFFAMQKKEEKPAKAPEKKQEAAKKASPEKKQEKKNEAPKKGDNKKPENNKPDNKKADNKKAEEKKAEQTEPKKHGESSLNPFKKNEKKKDGPMQSRTKGEKRTIDTRADDVQLDKYNERYENIAPVHSINDNVQTKQKLKQKSHHQATLLMRKSL